MKVYIMMNEMRVYRKDINIEFSGDEDYKINDIIWTVRNG
jgi:hypothetical protein